MAINLKIKKELERYLQTRIGRGENKAQVVSTYKLSDEELKSIQEAIPEIKKFEIENVVDDNLLGGFIIKFNTKIIDLSLREQLKNFKKMMYEID